MGRAWGLSSDGDGKEGKNNTKIVEKNHGDHIILCLPKIKFNACVCVFK